MPDAPALPITIAGVTFNVPPAAIACRVLTLPRRRGASRPRLPAALARAAGRECEAAAAAPPQIVGRVFMTISAAANTLAPLGAHGRRLSALCRRRSRAGPDDWRCGVPRGHSLSGRGFGSRRSRAGVSGALQPRRRGSHPRHGLYEQRIETADVVVRFPRDWLGGLAHGRRHHRSPGRGALRPSGTGHDARRRTLPARYPFSRPGSSRFQCQDRQFKVGRAGVSFLSKNKTPIYSSPT